MRKHAVISLILVALFVLLGWFFLVKQEAPGAKYPFRYGLDLVGGVELIYRADVTGIEDVDAAMETLKEIMETRVNAFGVAEPLVQVERSGIVSGNQENRLIIELPGYKDIEQAKKAIGATPSLEFRLVKEDALANLTGEEIDINAVLEPAILTGKYLSRARVEFDQTTRAPYISLEFNDEGADIFASITKEHRGKRLAIVLDNKIVQTPMIQDEIIDGSAQITGQFTPEEARTAVRNLNYGALPVNIFELNESKIGATLGAQALDAGVRAGVIGFIALSIFLVLWYRLPGLVSVVALISYIVLSLAIFKLIPVTLTAAGLAGFILSIGMAVDANVLIFERAKEEMKKGKNIHDALHEGFKRAWLSIRDSNISSIITAVVLFWLGTSAVKGFALTLGVGVAVSMFTALTLSRTFLFAIAPKTDSPAKRFLFSNGFHK